MKNILILALCLTGLAAFGAGEPIQRNSFTTNLPGAAFNAGGGTVTAANFIGPATGLTGIPAAQLTGTIPTNALPSPLVNLGAGLTATTNGVLVTVTTNGQTPAGTITGVLPIANGGTASATGNASGLTNVSLADGGIVTAGRYTIGSTSSMNPNGVGWNMIVNGSTTGYGNAGDNALIIQDMSTNFFDNSGIGVAVMGYGSSGATVLGLTQGPTLTHIPTNHSDSFMAGGSSIVMNYDSVSDKFFALCSPGGGNASASDSGNYGGLVWDMVNHLIGVPLIPGGNTNGGCWTPYDSVYDFTVSGVTTAPAFVSGYRDTNGAIFTAYSNNAAKTHLFLTGPTAPAASGTLTKIPSGAGDASITYSSVATNRTWNGWGLTVDQITGNVGINSNIVSTNGTFWAKTLNTAANGVNPFATGQTITFQAANASGTAIQDNGGVESVSFGTRGHYVASGNSGSSADLWYSTPTFDIGGDELANFNNRGSCELMVNGSLGLRYTNTAANYNVTVQDGVVSINGSGTITATLPDASSHAKGRIVIVKNNGTTNQTVLTTSSQTIDGKVGYTNAPQGTLGAISDGANWSILFKYLGEPTNIATVTATGITNTWNWPGTAYVLGTAIVYTNFNNAGIAVFTNTTLVNDSQAIHMQPGGFIRAASGLSGTMVANGN